MYSVWVCTDVPKYYQNTITAYQMSESNVVGDVRADKEHYDLLSVVMIGLGDPYGERSEGLLRFLSTLLSAEMSVDEKKRILQDEFNCSMMDANEEVLAMGSLGQALVDKTRIESTLTSIRNLMETMSLTLTEAMNALKVPEEERQRYIEALSK